MNSNKLIIGILLGLTTLTLYSQETKNLTITGKVVDMYNNPLTGVNVFIKGTNLGTFTDLEGVFILKNIQPDTYALVFSNIGFKTQTKEITLTSENTSPIEIVLDENLDSLNEVIVTGKTKATRIEEKGFSVDAIETQKIKAQSIEINSVLDRTAGVRVRKSGGVGSDFEYSLDGMSGNSIRFFIDGIPMDYYGSSYSINNLPISLIDRIDLYKGVVPVELGSDALGGAINLVTKEALSNFAEASYSLGSFNTHKITLNGQWRFKSGFTTRLSTFYTYSDNNYKVWGEGVFYADESTGFKAVEFTRDNPAERFNDDFETVSAKFDIGFTQKKWADQFFVTLLASDLKKGVQTAQTMSRVFGKVRNNEQTIMPSIVYKKKDFITGGLDVNTFAGYSYAKNVVVDTSYVQYDWRGVEIGTRASGGEMGYDGRSLFSQKDHSQIYRLNTTYQLPLDFKLGLNYVYSNLERTGEDPYAPEYRRPYIEPQNIGSHFAGLSLETTKFDDKLHASVFIKYYDYVASINELVYTDEYEVIEHINNASNWGGGLAASYTVFPKFLLKSSLENATRMPSPTEALGDGITISNNPFIEPEQSFNFNLGTILGRYELGKFHGVKIAMNVFYRNTKDKLWPRIIDGRGNREYINLNKISGIGTELDIVYDFDQKFKLTLNGTYLDFRNNDKFDELGRENIFYGDRMRNQAYFMANAGLEYSVGDIIQKKSNLFAYFQSSYVHQFFLDWESGASEDNKRYIPTQLLFDAGLSYKFPSQKLVLALDVSNILNEQVYDNFRLQKPGRAVFLKVNYQITN